MKLAAIVNGKPVLQEVSIKFVKELYPEKINKYRLYHGKAAFTPIPGALEFNCSCYSVLINDAEFHEKVRKASQRAIWNIMRRKK